MTKTKLSLLMLSLTLPGYSVADELREMQKNPDTWVMSAGDYANTRYSQLSEINLDNVKDLKMAWSFSTGVLRGHEGNSLIIDDVMYVHTPFPNIVFALDLNNDGAIKWKYEPKQNYDETVPVMCCDVVNRGLSYGDGKIFLNQADTTLVALDVETGEVICPTNVTIQELVPPIPATPMCLKTKSLLVFQVVNSVCVAMFKHTI